MASIRVRHGFGYNASKVECASQDVFVSICGNSLRFHAIEGREERFLFGAGRGIGGFACNRHKGLIAYYEKGVESKIYVHRTRDFELLSVLEGGAQLEFGSIAFSRDGERLASASREPDRKVIVWDWANASIIVESTTESDITQISFNPFDSNMLCTTGPGDILFWTVEKSYEAIYFEPRGVEVQEIVEIEPVCHEWNPRGGVYCGLATGELLLLDAYHGRAMEAVFDPDQPPTAVWADTGSAIMSVAVNKEYVCLGDEKGVLRWYAHAEEGKEPNEADHEIELGKWPVCSISYGESHQFLVVGTAESVIHEVRMSDGADGDFAESLVVGDYHLGKVTAVGVIPGGEYVVSCGEDGTLRCWNTSIGDLACKLFFSSEQTCLDVSDAHGLIATGAQTGIVRLVSAARPTELLVIWRSKLDNGPVKAVAFAPGGECLAAVFEDGHIFFLAVEPAAASAGVIGHTYLADHPQVEAIAWQDDEALLLSLSTGEVVRMDAPLPGASTAADLELAAREVVARRLKAEVPLTAICAHPAGTGLVALGADRGMKMYALPGDGAGWTGGKVGREYVGKEAKPEGEVPAHGKPGHALAVSQCGSVAVSGSLDGSVAARPVDSPGHLSSAAPPADQVFHDMKVGGVTSVGLGAMGLVCSAGCDGAVFVGTVEDLNFAASGPIRSPVPATATDEDRDLDAVADEPTVMEVAKARAAESEGSKHAALQAKMREKVTALQAKFDECLRRNEAAPELEKMKRTEFIIDQALCDELKSAGDRQAAELGAKLSAQNMHSSLVAQRIKEECWDPIEVKGCLIRALAPEDTSLAVRNYPLRSKGSLSTQMDKVLLLREVELGQKEYLESIGHVPFEVNAKYEAGEGPEGEEGADGAGAAPPPAEAPKPAEDGEEGEGGEGAAEGPSAVTGTRRLLYSPFELVCPKRKITQMYVLTKLIRECQEEFNAEWEATTKTKHSAMEKVAEINLRIKECAEELDIPPDLFLPDLAPDELSDSVLKVDDKEITAEKWVPPDVLAKRLAEEEAERAANAARSKDAPEERALRQMMNGTLEVPKEKADVVAPERPEWMASTDPATFTKEQRREVTEFEAMLKAWHDERTKYLSGFSTELRKLRSDVEEVCQKFDGQLGALFTRRTRADAYVYELQMGIIGLARALEIREESEERHEAELAEELEKLSAKRVESSQALGEFRGVAEDLRALHDEVAAEDKALDKAFKREFADCDVNVESLYKLFKRRHKVVRAAAGAGDDGEGAGGLRKGASFARGPSMARRPSMGGSAHPVSPPTGPKPSEDPSPRAALGVVPEKDEHAAALEAAKASMDPFAMADVRGGGGEEGVEPLDALYDRPEGLETIWWDKLVDARARKIQSEADVKKQSAVLSEATRHLARLQAADDKLRDEAEGVYCELEAFREHRARELYNLEVPLHIKQGQLEVGTQGEDEVSGDLGDAVLLHRSAVEDVNSVIVRHGDQKVEVLTAITDFKKGIYELEWLNQKLDMDAEDLVERTREFQLLRVTKQLQAFLKTGDEGGGGSIEAGALESRIEHNRKLHTKLVEERRHKLRHLNRNIADKRGQNGEMRGQVSMLDRAVAEQGRIREGQANGESVAEAQARRMRRLVTSRKLKDIAHAQSEELMMLREELERLRLRTFPSFVDREQPRIALSPDERIPLGAM